MTDRTMKDRTWAEIEQMAAAEQQRHPTLTKEQAIDAVVQTPEGRQLAAVYHDPDAQRPVAGFVAKQAQRDYLDRSGCRSWSELVVKRAEQYGGGATGLTRVREAWPRLWSRYQAEALGIHGEG